MILAGAKGGYAARGGVRPFLVCPGAAAMHANVKAGPIIYCSRNDHRCLEDRSWSWREIRGRGGLESKCAHGRCREQHQSKSFHGTPDSRTIIGTILPRRSPVVRESMHAQQNTFSP